MANPAPTINQINAFNATQGTIIDFNIIGGTELVRSNKIYIYDLSDNSLICTHLYVSTESIHELPPNTNGSIVYESGKSSADFVNGKQYYAQIQTFTDIAGTQGGSGLSVSKLFWCLVDPSLTIDTIPSSISTTSYNVSATYDANTSVVSNIIQQYQFSLYSATGSLLQSSGVVVGNGEQQGTSTAYDISYNFSGLSVGSSYYVVVDVTTTQGMSISAQSSTFTVSIDTPTLGEATVVNNACDGYISVTSNLSSEYGGSGSGEIVSFETDSENVFTKLQVDLEPVQDLHGYDNPWVGGAGKNKINVADGSVTTTMSVGSVELPAGTYTASVYGYRNDGGAWRIYISSGGATIATSSSSGSGSTYQRVEVSFTLTETATVFLTLQFLSSYNTLNYERVQIETGSTATTYSPYENICPITGHDEVDVTVEGKNLFDENSTPTYGQYDASGTYANNTARMMTDYIPIVPNTNYMAQVDIDRTASLMFLNYNYFDANKNWLGNRTTNGDTSLVGLKTKSINISNSNAKYLRLVVTSDPDGATMTGRTFANADLQLELGTTATTYEPYNGQTYTQEIEATLTPTVQSTEPYQFKATGDVGGDRESIELVGGTVAWNQLLYSQFEMNWAAVNADMSKSNGVATFTTNGNGNFYVRSMVNIQANHVYLFGVDLKLDSNNTEDFQTTTMLLSWGTGGYVVKSNPQKGSWGFVESILKPSADNTVIGIYCMGTGSQSSGQKAQLRTPLLVDLTQFFSNSTILDYVYSLEQSTAGSGIAWLKKYYPKLFTYNPHNTGELISVNASSHDTIGFNQWDEEWELGAYSISTGAKTSDSTRIRCKNKIPVLPNTSYFFQFSSSNMNGVVFYDADENYLGSDYAIGVASPSVKVTPSNAYYMCFHMNPAYGTTYNNDICINLSWDGERNGEYEPYVEHSYPLDSSLTLRGIPKIANGKLYYDGDTYESDGTVTRRFGIVDLSTLGWTTRYTETTNKTVSVNLTTAYKTKNGNPNLLCCGINYIGVVGGVAALNNPDNQSVGLYSYTQGVVGESAYSTLYAVLPKDSTPTGKILFELATPTTETADPFTDPQEVSIYGTEEFVSSNGVPVGNKTTYKTRDIFGGTLDLVSGVLTVTHGLIDLGTRTYSKESASVFYADLTSLSIKSQPNTAIASDVISSSYETKSVNSIQTSKSGVGYYTYSGNGHTYLYIGDSRYSTGADLKQALNGVQLVYPLATPLTYQLTPQQIQTLVGVNNVWSEQGDVELSYHIPITNLLVKRQDVADVSGDWLTLYSQPITQASDMDFTFIDFLNQYGKTYKYALVPLLIQQQSGVEVEVEGGYTVSDEVQSIFDGVFIADQTGLQKCKANVGYGDVDMNQAVGTITPIGAKYPVVITNSKNQYHNGSISGTIVPDDYYFNGNLSRIDMVNKRNELEQFLTNKRAKIIKDWNSNIWLVMIMENINCSFNNEYGMGLVNFNANWIEVGDPTNQQDLQAAGLIDVGGV